MLIRLSISNYALIKSLEIDFSAGLTVITGETGAGKSIILGALGLILGHRADASVLMDKERKCFVEGVFDLKGLNLQGFFLEHDIDFEVQTLLRREINPQGKSRAFINDTPVNLAVLKILANSLVDIHSQHEHLLLSGSSFQLDVIDQFMEGPELLKDYRNIYERLVSGMSRLAELRKEEEAARKDQDYHQYLFDELSEAQLQAGEQQTLEEELGLLQHAGEVKAALFRAAELLSGDEVDLISRFNELQNALDPVYQYVPSLEEIGVRIQALRLELKDIAAEITRQEERVGVDPQRASRISERLDILYALQHKHRLPDNDSLIKLKDDLQGRLDSYSSLSDTIHELHEEVQALRAEALQIANSVSALRQKVFPLLQKNILDLLRQMGMPNASFRVDHQVVEDLSSTGIDRILFLFTANKGSEPSIMEKIASGGELSRIVLAMKSLISRQKLLPTIIFDEIDSGISGEVADKVGNILRLLSSERQVMAITHLPQIAAKGDHHHYVYKKVDGLHTYTRLKILCADDRVVEIAKMISGESVSAAAVETARELLARN